MSSSKHINPAIKMITISFGNILVLMILLSMASCKNDKSSDAEENISEVQSNEVSFSAEQRSMAEIETGKPEQMILSEGLGCNGSVEMPPQSLVSVTLPLDGYVKKINAYSGSKVHKGDLLVVMEHPDYLSLQQEYMVTGNNLSLLKKNLDRQEILAKEDASSEKKLMASRTEYQNSLIRHTTLGEKLKMLGIDPEKLTLESLGSEVKVLSPINGHVRKNHVNMGELMNAGDPIMDLEDVSYLHVHLIIYEKDANRVKEGQVVEFRAGGGEILYKGSINTIGKSIDTETRSVTVHVHISNPDATLLSGMYVKARIMLKQKSVYALPEAGVARAGGESYVFISSGDSFKRVPVATGVIQYGFVEIKSPEALLGKDIVTAGAYYLNASLSKEE